MHWCIQPYGEKRQRSASSGKSGLSPFLLLLLHQPVPEMDDGVSECRHFLLMGNHQYRNAIGAIEVREQFHDLYGSFGVEIACGFVRKQHVGLGVNSPRDCEALLLAAGQFGGCMIPPILQTRSAERTPELH